MCACGLFHSVVSQETWAGRAAELTGYGAGVRGTQAERAKMLRAQVERDRWAVELLRHIAQLDGNAVLVKLSTTAKGVMDLLTRDMLAYCREHDRFSVTMVGWAVSLAGKHTEAALTHAELRIGAHERQRDARRPGDDS